jgi:preprotein translocase subunit SecG
MKIAFVVLYLVVAISMIAFIMLQRGSGAAAGSGFGSGASGTVFGARGASNFLSKATKWLAITFFALSMSMAVYEARVGIVRDAKTDLGVMGQLDAPTTPAAGSEIPAASEDAGAAPAASSEVPAATTDAGGTTEVPAAPAAPVAVESTAENASKETEKPQ